MAWKGDSRRHSLARKGIKTNIDQGRRFDVSTFVARGNDIGRYFDSEPENDELLEYWDIAIWFEDLPRDPKEQEKEIREWVELLEKRTNMHFQDLVDKAYKVDPNDSKYSMLFTPIDELFKKIGMRLLNYGHDVYESDTRMIVWRKGTIPRWYDTDFDEIANVISIPLMNKSQIEGNIDYLDEKYEADVFEGYNMELAGVDEAGKRREQLVRWLSLPDKKKKIFKELHETDENLFHSQLLGSTYEHLHPSAEKLAEAYNLPMDEAKEIFAEYESGWWWK